jgi:ankyrin repeat protein
MRCSFAQDGQTALYAAVLNGHHSIVGMLLAADADANSKNKVSAVLPSSFPLPQAPLVLRPTVDKLTQAACS